MAIKFSAVDPEVARATLARKTRSSKHRETLEAFYAAEDENGAPILAAQLDLTDDEGNEVKSSSVASGLLQALKAAKDNKVEWAEKIQVRNRADGVFLIRKDLMGNDAEAEATEEAAA